MQIFGMYQKVIRIQWHRRSWILVKIDDIVNVPAHTV